MTEKPATKSTQTGKTSEAATTDASSTPAKQAGSPRRLLRLGVYLIVFGVALWFIPSMWCARDAGQWFNGDLKVQQQLADTVDQKLREALSENTYSTGSAQFDGEWLFGTYMMAGMGFGQVANQHPQMNAELRAKQLERMTFCIDRIRLVQTRKFDDDRWNHDPLETLDQDQNHDHAAYLGYFNLLLSYHRTLDPDSAYAKLNDQITEALIRRINKSSTSLLESYPNEVYPVDNAAVIASIALHGRATGSAGGLGTHQLLVDQWIARCRSKWMDRSTGLMYQSMVSGSDQPAGLPRGSGTALAAYFLSFANKNLSRQLHQGVMTQLAESPMGFGAVREYPDRFSGREGDIDSGPLILGYSISSTGFTLGNCRIHDNQSYFAKCYATTYLFGAPHSAQGKTAFVTGGPLGNAIMFAMLTAQADPAKQDKQDKPTETGVTPSAPSDERESPALESEKRADPNAPSGAKP